MLTKSNSYDYYQTTPFYIFSSISIDPMKSISILTIILTSQIAYIFAFQQEGGNSNRNGVPEGCGENEKFVTCRSSSCFDEICEFLDKPRRCTRDCKAGCACFGDYVRGSDGKCHHKTVCFHKDAE